jgi:hypothetical protein
MRVRRYAPGSVCLARLRAAVMQYTRCRISIRRAVSLLPAWGGDPGRAEKWCIAEIGGLGRLGVEGGVGLSESLEEQAVLRVDTK